MFLKSPHRTEKFLKKYTVNYLFFLNGILASVQYDNDFKNCHILEKTLFLEYLCNKSTGKQKYSGVFKRGICRNFI